jgi:hypothetical protein
MLLAEVPGRGSDDRALADYNFAVLFQSLTDVILTHKVGRFLGGCALLRC